MRSVEGLALDNTCHKSRSATSFRALDAQPTTSTNMHPNKSNNSRPTIESGVGMIKADMLKNLGSIAQSGTKAAMQTREELGSGTNNKEKLSEPLEMDTTKTDITKARGSQKDVGSRRREKRTRTEQLATKRWDSEIKSERLACELMADIIICWATNVQQLQDSNIMANLKEYLSNDHFESKQTRRRAARSGDKSRLYAQGVTGRTWNMKLATHKTVADLKDTIRLSVHPPLRRNQLAIICVASHEQHTASRFNQACHGQRMSQQTIISRNKSVGNLIEWVQSITGLAASAFLLSAAKRNASFTLSSGAYDSYDDISFQPSETSTSLHTWVHNSWGRGYPWTGEFDLHLTLSHEQTCNPTITVVFEQRGKNTTPFRTLMYLATDSSLGEIKQLLARSTLRRTGCNLHVDNISVDMPTELAHAGIVHWHVCQSRTHPPISEHWMQSLQPRQRIRFLPCGVCVCVLRRGVWLTRFSPHALPRLGPSSLIWLSAVRCLWWPKAIAPCVLLRVAELDVEPVLPLPQIALEAIVGLGVLPVCCRRDPLPPGRLLGIAALGGLPGFPSHLDRVESPCRCRMLGQALIRVVRPCLLLQIMARWLD
jgi:hypothetical protein